MCTFTLFSEKSRPFLVNYSHWDIWIVTNTVMILSFRTDGSGQTVQTQIRVYTVCKFVCIFWMHYSTVNPSCSNFRVITANVLVVQIFLIFTVRFLSIERQEWELYEPPHNKTNKMTCAPRLIRVFAVRLNLKTPWDLSYPLSAQWRLWSDWADAQTDLSLRWAHRSFCRYCHAAAHLAFSFFSFFANF